MEIATKREKPRAAEASDNTGAVLHAAAGVAEAVKGSESSGPEESEPEKARKAEAEESVTEASKVVASAAAKTTDGTNVFQAVRVFEDAESFGAEFRSFWDSCWTNFCAYDETTTIPAMCYTHNTDANKVRIRDTLQIVSVEVASIKEGLRWPLQVFGVVSARDVVDYKRNIIFHRGRDNCQTITEQDPYLLLTGPSRAVVVDYDPSYIEVVLKVKGATESDDKELCRLAVEYRLSCFRNGLYPCKLSTLELTFSQVYRSVEATLHIKVTGGSWPDGFKGMFSAATARTECAIVKLLDVGDDGLPVDAADGMIRLSRNVVSVELEGRLKVYVSACSAAGYDEELCEGSFVPEKAGVSPGVELKIGSCLLEATVAWSLFCHDY
ncbi:unnamed protein product [Alopecurus aequalis]